MNNRPLLGGEQRFWDQKNPEIRGFTVIELMVVIAVIAIISSLALPSYSSLLEKRRVTSGAEQIAAFLGSVQMEAIRRNQTLSVSYTHTDDENWCIGVVSGATACNCTVTDPNASGACVIDSQLRVLTSSNLNHPEVVRTMTGDGSFAFEPTCGVMVDHSDAIEFELLSGNGTYALNVRMNAVGRVKTCSAASGNKVPGYQVCPG